MSSRRLVMLLATLLAVSCSARGPAGPAHLPEPGEPPAPTGAEEASSPGPAPLVEPGEERDWRVDEEGKEYYLEAFPKSLPYEATTEGRVKLAWGVEVTPAEEDEEYLYFKVYRVTETVPPIRREPTAEELEAVAATYRFELPSGDRLRFRSFADGLPQAGMWRNGFEIADLDGDGILDIVHGPMRKGLDVPVIYRGDGQGGWSQWMEPEFPRGLLDYGDVAVADFNGNGLLDLAVASHFRGIKVFVQEEPGRFVPWSDGIRFALPGQAGASSVFSSRRIVAADWSGDGRPDIIALDEGPRVARGFRGQQRGRRAPMEMHMFGPVVFLNQGDGTWRQVGGESPSRFELFGDHLAVADLSGNGRLDFLTSTNMMTRADLLHLSREDGTWESATLDVRPMAYVRAVAAGDFDHDGRADLVLSFLSFEHGIWRSGLDLYLAREGGWERRTLFAREGRVAFTAVEAGDLTGDGNLDLVAADGEGGALVLLGDGAGGFAIEGAPELQQPFGRCRAYQVRLADIDGGGRDEIVIAYAEEGATPAGVLTGALVPGERHCPTEGGIMAWTVEPRASQRPGRAGAHRP